ncbi:MAG: hypothetical protein WD847_16445 [Pirellulales bacterium]
MKRRIFVFTSVLAVVGASVGSAEMQIQKAATAVKSRSIDVKATETDVILQMENGEEVRLTAFRGKVLTTHGWKWVQDVQIGDELR